MTQCYFHMPWTNESGTDERVGVHGLDYLLMDTFGWPHYSSPAVEATKKSGHC